MENNFKKIDELLSDMLNDDMKRRQKIKKVEYQLKKEQQYIKNFFLDLGYSDKDANFYAHDAWNQIKRDLYPDIFPKKDKDN